MVSVFSSISITIFLLAQVRCKSIYDHILDKGNDIGRCPSGLDLHRDEYLRVHGNVCYHFKLARLVNYPTAKASCQRNGGMLAQPKSKDVNDYLAHVLKTELHYSREVWIGLHDEAVENSFFWEDGTSLAESGFSNWAHGQGTLVGPTSHDDCVAMDPDTGKWSDYTCASRGLFASVFFHSIAYVCQYNAKPEVTTTLKTSTFIPFTVLTQVVEIKITPNTLSPTPTFVSDKPSSPKYCPAIECDADCGPDGYKVDVFGCPTCLCNGNK